MKKYKSTKLIPTIPKKQPSITNIKPIPLTKDEIKMLIELPEILK